MRDRYGHDRLNRDLLILTAVLYFLNIFIRSPISFIISMIPFGLYIYRALSKNINKRLYENRKYTEITGRVISFLKLQIRKIKEIKTHKYVKCPYCKAQLRLKRITGKHTVRCPKCKEEFKVSINF